VSAGHCPLPHGPAAARQMPSTQISLLAQQCTSLVPGLLQTTGQSTPFAAPDGSNANAIQSKPEATSREVSADAAKRWRFMSHPSFRALGLRSAGTEMGRIDVTLAPSSALYTSSGSRPCDGRQLKDLRRIGGSEQGQRRVPTGTSCRPQLLHCGGGQEPLAMARMARFAPCCAAWGGRPLPRLL